MTDIALIGLGMVSGTYAAAIRDLAPDIRLKWAYARDGEARISFCDEHTDLGTEPAPDFTTILDDGDIRFAIVATPPNARMEIVPDLIASGIPVLMEKPVERTLAAAEDLAALATDTLPIGIMLQHRMRPAAQKMMARAAEFGPLLAVEASVPWWRHQSYYDAPGRGTYERDGGGVLISQAIHSLDLMLAIAGPVAEVTAMTATSGFHEMEAEDFVAAGMVFEGGAKGHLFASTASFPGRTESLTFHYARATATLSGAALVINHHSGSVEELAGSAATGAGANPMAFTSDWHRDMIRDFADALATGGEPMVTIDEALKVHRLIDALERSGKSGQRVTL